MDWITGIQEAINYVEDNLTGEIDFEEAAKRGCSFPFYFRRIFGVAVGMRIDLVFLRCDFCLETETAETDSISVDLRKNRAKEFVTFGLKMNIKKDRKQRTNLAFGLF